MGGSERLRGGSKRCVPGIGPRQQQRSAMLSLRLLNNQVDRVVRSCRRCEAMPSRVDCGGLFGSGRNKAVSRLWGTSSCETRPSACTVSRPTLRLRATSPTPLPVCRGVSLDRINSEITTDSGNNDEETYLLRIASMH